MSFYSIIVATFKSYDVLVINGVFHKNIHLVSRCFMRHHYFVGIFHVGRKNMYGEMISNFITQVENEIFNVRFTDR